ncbi:MAG: PAS domain S-box protein, partial [Comamonadaceae bacterium]
YTPIPGLEGKPVKVVKFASDITAAKLKSLEDDGKVAAIGRSQGVVEFDLAGQVLWANDNFLALTGYTLEEIRGRHHSLFIDRQEADAPAYRAFWRKLSDGEFDSGEYQRYGKDGKRLWIQASYNPILDLEGQPVKVVKFCTDITPTRLQAAENEARLAALSGGGCMAELGADGQVLSANDLLARALDVQPADLVGRPFAQLLFDADTRSPQQLARWQALREGRSASGELRMRASGDREAWFQVSLTPVLGLAGQLAKVLLIARDVTEEQRARLDADGKLRAIDRSQAVIEFDLQGRVLDANANFLKLTGYQLDDVRGRHHRMFLEPAAHVVQLVAGQLQEIG